MIGLVQRSDHMTEYVFIVYAERYVATRVVVETADGIPVLTTALCECGAGYMVLEQLLDINDVQCTLQAVAVLYMFAYLPSSTLTTLATKAGVQYLSVKQISQERATNAVNATI